MTQENVIAFNNKERDQEGTDRQIAARAVLAIASGHSEETKKEAAGILLSGDPGHNDLCLVIGQDLGEMSMQAWRMLTERGPTKKDIDTILTSMEHTPDSSLKKQVQDFKEQHPDLPEGSAEEFIPEEEDEQFRLAA